MAVDLNGIEYRLYFSGDPIKIEKSGGCAGSCAILATRSELLVGVPLLQRRLYEEHNS